MMINDIVDVILANKKFAILTHLNPDGDALGSAFALKNSLVRNGKEADLFLAEDRLPVRYSFLEKEQNHRTDTLTGVTYECLICLDCATKKRLGKFQDMLKSVETVINIDHHHTNELFGDYNLVLEYASTGEIVFEILLNLGWSIDSYTANAIYTAIATDSGRFAYENVNKCTFLAAAKLCEFGLDIPFVSNEVFFNRSLDATRMYGILIKNMETFFDGSLAVSYITFKDIEGLNIESADFENAIDVIREIHGVNVAVFIRQLNDNRFKISLRSKKDVDVAEVASIFGGGGHKRAAGCSLEGDLYDVRDRVIGALKDLI